MGAWCLPSAMLVQGLHIYIYYYYYFLAPGSVGVQECADSNTGNPGEVMVRELPSAFEAVLAIKEGFLFSWFFFFKLQKRQQQKERNLGNVPPGVPST